MSELDQVVSTVASSKKYGSICADTIRRIAERELARHGAPKRAVKATKRRLHQVYGAFEQGPDYDAAIERLAAASGTGSDAEIKEACRDLLASHSSTRERLPVLDGFYPSIWAITGLPTSLLDLGCGLNPVALPWMGLPLDTRYIALDIDADRIRFLNRYLSLAGLEPLARCQDVLVHPPAEPADVALLLKMSPSLERQEQGATLRLLEQLRTPFVVVSFAVKSLGGRERGMVEHYQRQFQDLVRGRQWEIEKLAFASELVFVVARGA
jgi:16S rRNA (guanine(1405)-N(7))-methyltransferase